MSFKFLNGHEGHIHSNHYILTPKAFWLRPWIPKIQTAVPLLHFHCSEEGHKNMIKTWGAVKTLTFQHYITSKCPPHTGKWNMFKNLLVACMTWCVLMIFLSSPFMFDMKKTFFLCAHMWFVNCPHPLSLLSFHSIKCSVKCRKWIKKKKKMLYCDAESIYYILYR